MNKFLFDEYRRQYQESKEPISVNFRDLVPMMNNKERYTHLIHSYPAKLLSNIPFFFLSEPDVVCPQGGVVLDPFCGTGTVLLEAMLGGYSAFGADANPLARLISKVKTTYIPKQKLLHTLSQIISRAHRLHLDYPIDDSIKGWFSESTIKQLYQLETALNKVTDVDEKDFFMLCFSQLIKKVSYADPTISVPVKLNPSRFPIGSERRTSAEFRLETLKAIDVIDKYESICRLNIDRVDSLSNVACRRNAEVISADARKLTAHLNSTNLLQDDSVDLILTSPPYAGAQKYIRSSRLNLYWLGIKDNSEIRKLNDRNIGREDYKVKEYKQNLTIGIPAADEILSQLYARGKYERAYIVGNYLLEMKVALDEAYRVLKPNGYMVIVIGNNTVCNLSFNTQDYLTTYLESKGMTLEFKLIDDIKSYGLMTKRNSTANKISCEWVLILKK